MGENLFRTEDIIAKIAEVRSITKAKAREEYDGVFSALGQLIKDETHDGVAIHGVATIKVVHKDAHMARNPKTGEAVEAKEKYTPKIKLSKRVKNLEF